MKYEFNNDQLFMIEKVFDNVAHDTQRAFADTVSKLNLLKESKKKQRFINKLLDECVKAYDMCRTISAICENNRNQRDD